MATRQTRPTKIISPATPPLYAHQDYSVKHGRKNPIVLDLSDPGTGKTAVRITVFAERRRKGGGCMLVLAPKNLLKPAWWEDFGTFAPDMRVVVATAENREAAFAEDADVYVTNVDATKWLAAKPPKFFAKFDELVFDEITAFKHATSQRSRAANKIKKYFKYRSGLTGTPNSNTICDIWHPMFLLDDGKRLGKLFYSFRSSVCTPEQVGPRREMVNWVDKEGAEEAVFGLLADITVRHKFEDCIDIPENHKSTVPYFLSDKQLTAYKQMETAQIATLITDVPAAVAAKARAKPVPTTKVTAINAAAVTTKLLQIASGAVYESPGKYHLVDTGRYEMILDMVEQRKHSLVFFLWQHQRDLLVKEAEKRGITYCVFDGSATTKERDDMVRNYQAGFYKVMFAHPKSAGHGLTLTKGTATIWASPTYDLEIFAQGNKRQHRAGQTQKTETIVVLAKDTIEQRVYDRLLVKGTRMTNLLNLFSEAA